MLKSILSLLVLLTASCSQGSRLCPSIQLSAQEYQSEKKCWIGDQGEFRALMVLSETKTGLVPTFLSAKCKNAEFNGNELFSLAEFRNSVLYDGTPFAVRNEAPLSKPILSNYSNHKVPISKDDKVYYIRAEADIIENQPVMEVSFRKVQDFRDTGRSLGEVLAYRVKC